MHGEANTVNIRIAWIRLTEICRTWWKYRGKVARYNIIEKDSYNVIYIMFKGLSLHFYNMARYNIIIKNHQCIVQWKKKKKRIKGDKNIGYNIFKYIYIILYEEKLKKHF